MGQLRILIVDDEPLVRDAVRKGIAAMTGTECIGECGSKEDAVVAIRSLQPALVLLDIQMQDGSGIDVVEQVGVHNMPPVIFITAYDEFAVKAFELNAVDYILKPFDTSRLHAAIERAQRRSSQESEQSLLNGLGALLAPEPKDWPDRIVVRNGDRYEFVLVKTIDWIEAADNYTQLHCGPKCYLHSESLTSLEQRLDPNRFLRVHRGKIVNMEKILSIRHRFAGTYELCLGGGTILSSGRNYREAVQSYLLQ